MPNWFLQSYRSAVGKKAVMAVTGILLFAYVLLHMLGNLKLYQGAEPLNHYAEWLREVGMPLLPHAGMLWIVRIGLLAAFGLHLLVMIQLTWMNRRARPQRYEVYRVLRASVPARTMRWTGVLIGAFVIFHLLDLTWGVVNPAFEPGNVFHNVVTTFSRWWVAGIYIAAQVALGLHMYHGLWSFFQSLGWNHPVLNHWRRTFATAFTLLVVVVNISFPLAVLWSWVG